MIITVVGNRPQFIKMAPISTEFRARGIDEYIIHTGQHYDENMSGVFFEELGIPEPNLNLEIQARSHGGMTAEMLERLEKVFIELKPKSLLIYGDTNSTLAAALAAVKLHIPIAHVEAGPRIYDIDTPEEINRIVADHAARLRFAPDQISIENLAKENITTGVIHVGDLMYQAFMHYRQRIGNRDALFQNMGLDPSAPFALMTIHRPNNTDDISALEKCIEMLKQSPMPVVFAVHPRTEAVFKKAELWDQLCALENVHVTPPLGYLDLLGVLEKSAIIMTDSGGLQKEAYFAGKPCLVMFHATPWPQILEAGWQKLSYGFDRMDVSEFVADITGYRPTGSRPEFFGDGKSAQYVVDHLVAQDFV